MKKILLSLTAASMLIGGVNVVASANNSEATTAQYLSETQARLPFTGHAAVAYNNVRFWNVPGGTALGQVHEGTRIRYTLVNGSPRTRTHNGNIYHHATVLSGTGSNGNAGRSGYFRADFLRHSY